MAEGAQLQNSIEKNRLVLYPGDFITDLSKVETESDNLLKSLQPVVFVVV